MNDEYVTVRLRPATYRALERRRRDDESFSDVVERLARERPIADLAGTFDDVAVDSFREARSASYEQYAERRSESAK